MKLNQLLFLCAILSFTLFAACQAGGEGGEGDDADTTAMADDTMAEDDMEGDEMAMDIDMQGIYIIHDVNDYDSWKTSFDEHEAKREEAGLKMHWVAREATNPNQVHVALGAKDMEKARKFSASKDLKSAMKDAGVQGKPNIRYYELLEVEPTDDEGMKRMAIAHEVEDYEAWRAAYDAHADARAKAGLEQRAMARNLDNPNQIFIMFSYKDEAKAKDFAGSEDLKMKMEEAGVTGEPEMYWLNITDMMEVEE